MYTLEFYFLWRITAQKTQRVFIHYKLLLDWSTQPCWRVVVCFSPSVPKAGGAAGGERGSEGWAEEHSPGQGWGPAALQWHDEPSQARLSAGAATTQAGQGHKPGELVSYVIIGPGWLLDQQRPTRPLVPLVQSYQLWGRTVMEQACLFQQYNVITAFWSPDCSLLTLFTTKRQWPTLMAPM